MNVKQLSAGVTLCTHKTQQFKTSVVSVNIIAPLSDEASENALLIHLLARTNKDNPTITKMNRTLASLYGAMIIPKVHKDGEAQVLTLSLVSIDDRFSLDGEAVLEKGIKLLCECIFRPDITPEGFKEENLEREKRLLIEKIESEKDDKRVYALERMTEEMCSTELYGISKYGNKEKIEALTGKELLSAWKKLIFTCPVQINVTGNFDEEKTEKIFFDIFSKLGRKKDDIAEIHTEFVTEAYESKIVREKQKVKQGKLVIGMRAGMTYDYDNYPALKVMTAVFGSGTFSKLFMNVREKMSLCYYCSANLNRAKGIITVQSGVETENAEKALEAIRNELDDMRKGNFTDEVIENAKLSLKETFNTVFDNVMMIDGWFTSHVTSGKFRTPEEFISDIEKVSREEIILAACCVTEDTVYILEGEKEEE